MSDRQDPPPAAEEPRRPDPTARPFQRSRAVVWWLTDEETTDALDRAHDERDRGDTAAAHATLVELHRRAVETFGIGHRRLAEIEAAIEPIASASTCRAINAVAVKEGRPVPYPGIEAEEAERRA